MPPLSARLWIAGFGDKASSTPRQQRDVASKAALDSRIWRQSFINAASEKAFVLMSLLQFITRLCRQSSHHQRRVLVCTAIPVTNLVQTRACISPHTQTSAARTAHRGSGRGLRSAAAVGLKILLLTNGGFLFIIVYCKADGIVN